MERPDVLIAGGGTAALCAALAARRRGASVLLLEAAPRALRGGNTRHARNLRLMHLAPTPYSPGVYSAEAFRADLERACGETARTALSERLIAESNGLDDWLSDQGVVFQPIAGGLLPESHKTVFLLGGGKAMLNALYGAAERAGVVIRYGHRVSALSLKARRLYAVRVHAGAERLTLYPRALIACTGGAQANRRWLRRYWGAAAEGFLNRGTPETDGHLLAALRHAGAQLIGDPGAAYLVAVDARSPRDDGGIATRIRAMPAGIVVDSSGRRFQDEGADSASTRYAAWGQRLAACPGQIAWLILDEPARRAAPPTLYPPLSAATPEALGARLGIDGVQLGATLAAYNAAVRPPADASDAQGWHTEGLEPPKSRQARALDTPPYHAWPMRPGLTFTYQGVAVDEHVRVRLRDGSSAPDLFAAGMLLLPNILPRGYVSGLGLTISAVFGRLAGEEAARHVLG